MIITDRSRTEADWRCGMERYWSTEFDGQGLTPLADVLPLDMGSAYSKGVQDITTSTKEVDVAVEEAGAAILPKYGSVHASIVQGLLYGYTKYMLPRLLDDYDILGVESEMELVYPYPPQAAELLYMIRPDLVLRRRSDQTVWVPDDKTTKWKDQQWLDKWPWAVQLQLQAAAVAQNHPEWNVQGSIVIGAYKGYEKDGKVFSVFAHGYRRMVDGKVSYSYRYVAGWERFPVTEYPGGIKAWVDAMPDDILCEMFPTTRPIMLDESRVMLILKERLYRERKIEGWRKLPNHKMRQAALPMVFEHRTVSCNYCNFKEACWSPTVNKDPLHSKLYKVRVPNHQLELVAMQELDERAI